MTYNVNYNLDGASSSSIDNNPDQFGEPVPRPRRGTAPRRGRRFPVKFSLHGNQGLSIFATGYRRRPRWRASGIDEPRPDRTVRVEQRGRAPLRRSCDQYDYVEDDHGVANT